MNNRKYAMKELIKVLSRRPRKITLQGASGPMLVLLISGCVHIPQSLDEVGPRYKPTNIYRQSDLLPPRIHRVAILPLTTPNSTALLAAGVEGFETVLYAELEKTGRFEIIPVSGEQLREWTGQSRWKADEQLPRNFLERLREGTGCDAVLFCQLIRYQPYEPLAVGWKFTLVDKGDAASGVTTSPKDPAARILWSADEVFDAGDVEVATAARVYYSQHLRDEAPLADSSTVLGSPSRFGQYTLNALFATLPRRQPH
jgi:hypothetical protein